LNILFVSSEIFPYSKTGGLADVAGSLPNALVEQGCRVVGITPFYKETRKKGGAFADTGKRITVPIGEHPVQGTLLKSKTSPFPLYLIDQPSYFNRDHLYGDERGDYYDSAERFIFFCRAALEACVALGFHPHIIHCHDWHTGLIPAYLKTLYGNHPLFKDTSSVFTIHNLAYQGNFGHGLYHLTGLGEDLFRMEGLEFHGQFSFLKAGLAYSGHITTVSETYREEILEKENGCGMEGVLKSRKKKLRGIVNGIDCQKWDPETDGKIAANFSSKNRKGKEACGKDLLGLFRIRPSMKTPILSMVTRLTHQKGIDLVMESMDSILQRDLSLILLGSGDRRYEEFFRNLAAQYPARVGVCLEFSEDLAHKVYAGTDIFLMPSRFEPCGISQMISMRYGGVPLVHSVGGLVDTVQQYDPGDETGCGFCFTEFSPEGLLTALDLALAEFHEKKSWDKLVKRVMERDYSWTPPSKKYLEVYKKVAGI
jgi:starch synthase